jgi:hypothetical protein
VEMDGHEWIKMVIFAHHRLWMKFWCFWRIEPAWILIGEASKYEFKLSPPVAKLSSIKTKRVHKKIVSVLKTSGWQGCLQ